MTRRAAAKSQTLPLELYERRVKLLESGESGLDIDLRFRMAASQAISESDKSRAQIAAAMTDLMYPEGGDQEVTLSALNTWTAPSKMDRRFPLSHLPAFVEATGAFWLLDLVAQACGAMVVKKDQAWLLDLAAAIAVQRNAEARISELTKGINPRDVQAVLANIGGSRR